MSSVCERGQSLGSGVGRPRRRDVSLRQTGSELRREEWRRVDSLAEDQNLVGAAESTGNNQSLEGEPVLDGRDRVSWFRQARRAEPEQEIRLVDDR